MRIRRIVMVGVAVGAVALAGCTRTAPGDGIGQGYRGARSAQAGVGPGQRAAVQPASERTGRGVAVAGTPRTLSGTLTTDGVACYLEATDGRYLLHLGNAPYVGQSGLLLKAGEPAVAKGIVDANEVSVISLEIEGRTYAFRSEDGSPLWAGGGRGAGQGAGRGAGRAAGRSPQRPGMPGPSESGSIGT